jgi:hypothetical protein
VALLDALLYRDVDVAALFAVVTSALGKSGARARAKGRILLPRGDKLTDVARFMIIGAVAFGKARPVLQPRGAISGVVSVTLAHKKKGKDEKIFQLYALDGD